MKSGRSDRYQLRSAGKTRRSCCFGVLPFVTGLLISGGAFSQAFPTKPLRLVVPYTAGGSADAIVRPLSERMAKYLGQPVLLDHKPGANSIIGTDFVAKSMPDGYTLLLAATATVSINPVTYKTLPFNVSTDLAPVALVCSYPLMIMSRGGLPANSLSELIALARSKPGQVTYGSPGNGSQGHFGGALLEIMAGVKMSHVPYKGSAEATTDVLGDRLDFMMSSATSFRPHAKSGKLKLLATGGARRSPEYPDVPTVAESFPGFLNETTFSILTRNGSPRSAIARLNSEINRALRDADIKGPLEAAGNEVPANSTPESLAQSFASDTERWSRVARETNIRFD